MQAGRRGSLTDSGGSDAGSKESLERSLSGNEATIEPATEEEVRVFTDRLAKAVCPLVWLSFDTLWVAFL